jgi:diguanylate cyclase (GGDEF)-like protein
MVQDFHWRKAIELMPLGVLVLDRGGRVMAWNAWLTKQTTLEPDRVVGRTLAELFPGFESPRFEWALEQVFTGGSPQLLSQSLNRHLIPIKTPDAERHGLTFMQQNVQLSPLSPEKELCLVTISDVTENVIRSAFLLQRAKALQETSLRDPLTALYNRRFMWEWLAHELPQALRHAYPVGCLMIDIDHFKTINDTLGHDAGDRVLVDLATLLGGQLRESDGLARYGGEEFVVLFPYCPLDAGIAKAQRIVEAVRGSSIGGLETGRVTCSIGVAAFDPEHAITGDEMLKQADLRLYEAKNAGRNRVAPDNVRIYPNHFQAPRLPSIP